MLTPEVVCVEFMVNSLALGEFIFSNRIYFPLPSCHHGPMLMCHEGPSFACNNKELILTILLHLILSKS